MYVCLCLFIFKIFSLKEHIEFRKIMIVIKHLVAFFLLTSCFIVKSAPVNLTNNVKAHQNQNLAAVDKSLAMFLKYALKLKKISEYTGNERGQAFSKFMEIHDELINSFDSAEDEIQASTIKLLLKYLERQVKNSALLKPGKKLNLNKQNEPLFNMPYGSHGLFIYN